MGNGMEVKLIRINISMIQKFLNIIFSFFFIFALFSCTEFWRDQENRIAEDNYISPYLGIWTGTYSGDESGNLTLNIKKDGRIEVTRKYNEIIDIFYTTVYEGGSIYNSPSPNTGFTLYGNMEQKGGTWKQGSSTGTWSVTKQ